MPLSAKDIHVIRMIIREEMQKGNVSAVQATIDPNARYAAGVVSEPVYMIGKSPFQRIMSESEYNEHLSALTQD